MLNFPIGYDKIWSKIDVTEQQVRLWKYSDINKNFSVAINAIKNGVNASLV